LLVGNTRSTNGIPRVQGIPAVGYASGADEVGRLPMSGNGWVIDWRHQSSTKNPNEQNEQSRSAEIVWQPLPDYRVISSAGPQRFRLQSQELLFPSSNPITPAPIIISRMMI